MKQLAYLYAAPLLFLAACNGTTPIPGNEKPASVIQITADNQQHYLTDYFPTLGYADSITSTNGLTIISQDSCKIFSISGVNNLSTLDIWKNGQKLTLAATAQGAKKAYIYSLSVKGNSVAIGFSVKPENVVALWQNTLIPQENIAVADSEITLTLPKNISQPERSFIRIFAAGEDCSYNDLLIPLENGKPITNTAELSRHDKQAQVLYSLMIDRFQDGNTANDRKLNRPDVLPKVDYMGGDLKGITQKIQDGFFDSLGISTIWISPITQNPNDAWGQYHNPDTKFSGYHGYWPIYITKIDDRFGNDAELKELLATAHEHNLNVILDYVANHLHINSPIIQQHPDWVTDSITPDGRRNFELWDEFRLTTWFDVHIPSLDLARPEVYQPMTDSALYWIANYDFDGFRHDACKHIPLEYWRTLTQKMKTRFPQKDLWQIGETYGDPELIGSYVKSGMLDAQFDFNIYHTAIDVFGRPDRSMKDIARVIAESQAAYGAHHTMGNISGNHDKARFISLAGGALSFDEDAKAAGWNRTITVGDTAVAYKKSLLLEVLNMTIPGVPCIYQGDEYGQPGGNDPDNRHMMRFDGYDAQEQAHLQAVENMIKLRRNSMPMLYGDYVELFVDDDLLIFARIYMGQTVVVAINKGTEARTTTVTLPQGLTINQKATLEIQTNGLSWNIIN